MKRPVLCVLSWLGVVGAGGCLPGNPIAEGTTTDDTADSTGGDGGPMAGGELLGCPSAAGCTMVLAVQTLDDRVEVFVPDHPDSAYRGAISVDFEPNECMGCGPGDIGEERLEEPFGIARAGGFLHVLTGHYPTRLEGSLVSFPLSFLEGYPAGSVVPASDYFAAPAFSAPVLGRSLQEIEPIFMHQHSSGRLLVGVFNNDLFAGEETWTGVGKILVIDPTDPEGEIGEVTLEALSNGECHGASQIIDLGGTIMAVACDGNEGVAVLDGSSLAGTVAEAAATLGNGNFCAVPGAMPGKRVRYLAADGLGGFVVAEGPTPQDVMGSARLWHMTPECSLLGDLQLSETGSPGDWQLAELVPLTTAASPTWLVAAGSSLGAMGLRGIYVVYQSAGALELCPTPMSGFGTAWDDGAGGVLEPYALGLTSDGTHLAVGAGPFIADPAGVGRGKILWATLSGTEPCSITADVLDLTDGSDGRAPAPSDLDPLTFRRGPNVVVIQEISGT